jgi:hypothetical protein
MSMVMAPIIAGSGRVAETADRRAPKKRRICDVGRCGGPEQAGSLRTEPGTPFAARQGMDALRATRSAPPILTIRNKKVVLDRDLAVLYDVVTGRLNQAVKRNRRRFPPDFAFQLTAAECRILKSQFVISSRSHGGRRTRPWAFTEHGALMAASVLNTNRAISMSVFVVRAFLRLRDLAAPYRDLALKLTDLEQRVAGHDDELHAVIAALRRLIQQPARPRRAIGFATEAASPPCRRAGRG